MASEQKNVKTAQAVQGASGTDNSALQNRIDAVAREMQFLSQQNTAMFESFEEKLANLKREFAYLNQQNLSVYNMTTDYVRDALEKSQAALEEKISSLADALGKAGAQNDDTVLPSVEVVVDHDRIVNGIVSRLQKDRKASKEDAAQSGEQAEPVAVESVGGEEVLNYDVLAEKIADNIPPVDYDYLACKIVNNMTAFDQDALAGAVAQKIADSMPARLAESDVTAEAVAESVVARLQETPLNADANAIAETVADKVVNGIAAMDADNFATLVADKVAAVPVSSAAEVAVDSDSIVEGIIARLQEAPIEVDIDALANNLAERIEVPPLEVDFEDLAANIADKIDVSSMQLNADELAESVAGKIDLSALALNADELAESVAAKVILPPAEVDYDLLAEKILEGLPEVDYQALSEPVIEGVKAVLAENAETVSASSAETQPDTDALASAIAEKVEVNVPEMTVDTDALAESIVSKLNLTVPEPVVDAEALAASIAEKVQVTVPETTVDTDALAGKIIEGLPEVDYVALSEPVIAGVVAALPAEPDADALADKIVEKLEAEEVTDEEGVDEAAEADEFAEIAQKVAEALDYDVLADKLAEKLSGDEEDVEAYLNEHDVEVEEEDDSARVISAVEENSGKTNALVEEVIELLKQKQFVTVAAATVAAEETPAVQQPSAEEEPAEEPVQEVVDEPAEEDAPVETEAEELAEEPVQEVVDEPVEEETEASAASDEVADESAEEVSDADDAERELSIAEAAAETEALRETAQEQGKTVRLKRSYECKLRQADDEIKYYYSEIKNEMLAYARVKSGMSWNGDRFNLGRDTIAKININGKTLCLYLALNPDEYSITKYHHKYVGDIKAYESTPMMVKVKSNMGLKKAVQLIFEMMEHLKAQRKHRTPVDYVAEYPYKSDEELIAEGLIKASITEKKDLESF